MSCRFDFTQINMSYNLQTTMTSLGSFYALISLLNLVSCTLAEEDWKDIHNQVYAMKGDHLHPTKTYELLEILENAYKGRPEDGLIRRSQRVGKLLSMARLTESDCDWEHFHVFEDLIRYHYMYSVNVVPYLKHYRREWSNKCEERLDSMLRREISQMSGAQRTEMESLRQNVVISDNGLNVANYMSKLSLDGGIIKFIEQQSGPFDPAILHKSKLGFREVARRFETHVLRLCESITIELKPTMKIYKSLKNDKVIVKHMNHFLLEWLTNVNVCEDILSNADEICWNAYKYWLHNHPTTVKRLVNTLCFRSKNGCK